MSLEMIARALPLYIEAFANTLLLGATGVVLSLVLGFLASLAVYFKLPVVSPLLRAYVEVARNTPLLIQLFFLYYGLPKLGLTMEKETVAIVGLTFLGTAYMLEAFRSAYEAVPKSQVESGRALALSPWQLARYVIFPQALPVSLSSLGANAIFLLKETSVLSGIAIMDLTNQTRNLIGLYYRTGEYLLLLVGFYILLILPVIIILNLLERRLARVRI
ncbi:polar amino acid ABC transporter permease [Aerococcus urinaehominis]|uniref:Polar amino acid ABC transporter permease n=1 Tax=Aerococcus urinaehominis TaxID=128944 RepID=A0A0X8FM39_9LACT|nr:amino acid ABC transporter permease [Aerococcus urinaehominis]AMB99838.1 polar amino acid ABC transporter permease [Aerococcus urinaehominis]SDM62805.1 amino acid ABC transporter membrane protein 1, PAAT family (TC 3.A.1.3.-) [Aerococcus urinaehominis]